MMMVRLLRRFSCDPESVFLGYEGQRERKYGRKDREEGRWRSGRERRVERREGQRGKVGSVIKGKV